MVDTMEMKCKVTIGNRWLKIGSNWWVTNSCLAENEPPATEHELIDILRHNINTSSILIIDDCVLLYAGQFYSDNIFYCKSNNQLSVSDDLRQLISQDYKLDAGAIANYVFAKGFYFNQTPFQGVFKVSQGCLCKFTCDSTNERYLGFVKPTRVPCTPKRFLSLMEEKLQFVNKKQVLSPLSGGLDSSFVAAFIKRHFDCSLQAFHIYCSQAAHRELEQARFLCKKLQIPLIEIDFTWQRFNETFLHFSKLSPLPFPNSGYRYYLSYRYGNTNIHPNYIISGDASDGLFELNPDFYLFDKISAFDRWMPLKLYEKLDHILDRARPTFHLAESLRWRINKYLDFRLRLYHWKGTRVDYHGSWRVPFFSTGRYPTLLDLINRRGMYDIDNRLFLLNTYWSYLELPIFISLIRQQFGAEYFTPFLDRDITGLALNLSSKQTRSKHFLKQVASSYIPSEIITRKKMGFVTPFQFWLPGPMRSIATELLLGRNGLVDRGIVNEDALIALVRNFFNGSAQFGCWEIMSLVALEVWLRVNFDNRFASTEIEKTSLAEFVSSQQSSWF